MDAIALAHGLVVWAALQSGAATAAQATVETVHRFSGQQIHVPFRFYGGQGHELELRARPYQLAHSLAAPVGPMIEVATGVELGEEPWHDFSLTLDCPAVDRITTWELRFESRLAGKNGWRRAGTTRVELYPRDVLAPLRELASISSLFVIDAPGALRAFLGEHGVPFQDLASPSGRRAFEHPPAKPRPTLVLWVRGPEERRLPRPRTRTPVALLGRAARVLVFAEPSPLLPHTTLRLEPHRTRVTVDIDLLSSLRDDPRAQLQLVEAIRMTQIDLGDGSAEWE